MTDPARHPFVLRIAQRLLARADLGKSDGPVRLTLDAKVAPELHAAPDDDQLGLLRLQLDDLCATGWVALHLDPPRPFASFADRRPRLELLDADALAVWAGYTRRAQRWQQKWRAHLAAHWQARPDDAPPDPAVALDYLNRNPLTQLDGLPLDVATRSLVALIALCRSGAESSLREASARAFQGRSKVLDHREELLRLLGAAPDRFREAPIQLLLAPPATSSVGPPESGARRTFGDVLFVENLVTFENMADRRGTHWAHELLVYAAGFRGSAARLRTPGSSRLYLRAPTDGSALPDIEQWLYGTRDDRSDSPAVRFFGDLDFAGMQILASLRQTFPQATAWRPGYDALADRLRAGDGHVPEAAAKALQTDPGTTGCLHADTVLLPLLRAQGRFVDQEIFEVASSG